MEAPRSAARHDRRARPSSSRRRATFAPSPLCSTAGRSTTTSRDHGVRSFTDHGKTIDIYDSRNRESVLAALQLSAQKWGTISVHGNREFMRTCVELAAEHGFKIANPELQEAIAAERQRHRPAGSAQMLARLASGSRPDSL